MGPEDVSWRTKKRMKKRTKKGSAPGAMTRCEPLFFAGPARYVVVRYRRQVVLHKANTGIQCPLSRPGIVRNSDRRPCEQWRVGRWPKVDNNAFGGGGDQSRVWMRSVPTRVRVAVLTEPCVR